MANKSISIILAALVLCGAAVGQNKTLRELAQKRGIDVGAAVAVGPLKKEKLYRRTVEREFGMIVAENAFKWDAVQPERGKFNFRDTDYLVEFAAANRMKLRGHTLVWHRQIPKWLAAGGFTRDELVAILKNHIQTLVGRYRGKIAAWDVVNEAIDDRTGGYRTDSFWHKNLGPDYIALAFRFAREADPRAALYYNDYSAEAMNAKSDGVYKLVAGLVKEGAPVDGVGWQMHLENGFRVAPEHRENARRLAALGLEISITELDVRARLPLTPEASAAQADAYRDVARFCLAEAACKAIVTWGLTDRHSWIPNEFPGTGDALIFDRDYRPKPAYRAMAEVLENEGERK